jgi:hypothetical protein
MGRWECSVAAELELFWTVEWSSELQAPLEHSDVGCARARCRRATVPATFTSIKDAHLHYLLITATPVPNLRHGASAMC